MANPATTLARTGQDERIPGLPVLPPGTDPATLTVPVYNPATDKTHQAPIGGAAAVTNAIIGGVKVVQYLDSGLYGVPPRALTLDRLAPATIVPGTLAVVANPSSTPLTTTEPPQQYVATQVAAGTSGSVLVPRYVGAAATDTVPITWQASAALPSMGGAAISALELRFAVFDCSPALLALRISALVWLKPDGLTSVPFVGNFSGTLLFATNRPADGSVLAYLDAQGEVVPVPISRPVTLSVALADTPPMLSADPPIYPWSLYAITGDWNGAGTDSTVHVAGLTASSFAPTGCVFDANGTPQTVTVDVAAGTWEVPKSGSQFLTGTYTVQPADVTNPASALVIPVPSALVFVSVSIEGGGGQGNPLVYGTGYTSQPDVLTIAAGISPALQAGEIVHYSYLKGDVAAPAAGTRSQHSTTQSMRTTGPFIFQTADKPGLLSAVIVDNITTLSAQVNYRDPARPSIWFAGTVRTSASASPADIQALMAQIYSDIQAIPAASLALAGELLFRTQPLDTTLPANFLLDGAGPFYFLGISRSFRVNYAGPPIGQVLINPQFTNSTDGWNASVQGSWVFGNGSASTVNGNPQRGAFFQRKTVAAGKYEVEYDIDQINLGSARLIVDAGQPYAVDTIVTAPGVYKYTVMLPAGSVDVDILNAQDIVVNHIYLTPVP